MKKLFMILLAALIILPSAVTAYAANAVSFTLDSVEGKKNRLIEIDMKAICDKKLAAALFSFTYDKSVLEFRKASVPAGSKVVTNETEECVRLSYLCADGAEIKNSTVIFTLTFKAIDTGSSAVDFTAYDCVGPDAQWLDIGSCTSGQITIEGSEDSKNGSSDKQSSESGGKSKSKVSDISGSDSKSSSKKGDSAKSQSTTSPATAAPKTNDKIQNDYNTVVPIVVLCISITTAVCFIAYLAYRLILKRKEKKNPDQKND